MFSGLRQGEINALTIDDINLEHGFINIDKTISKGANGRSFVNSTTKTINGVSVIEGKEEIEKMDALLSLAITGGDYNWI